MPSKEDKYYKNRVNSSYITSVISITLVLFTLGVLGLIVLQANSLSNYIKENIGFEIIIKPDVKEADILYLQKTLDLEPFVKTSEYITKEEASERLTEMLGDEFTDFLGEEDNPLLPSIDLRFNAQWANNDSLAIIEQSILENKNVKEVYYQKSQEMIHEDAGWVYLFHFTQNVVFRNNIKGFILSPTAGRVYFYPVWVE